MAADRGRDLPIRILSDLDRFDVDPAATALERVGDAAEDAGGKLRDLDDDTRKGERSLEAVGDAAKDAGGKLRDLDDDTRKGERSLEGIGDEAKDTAKKVDDAFEKIAKSSRSNLRNKLDADTDKAKASLGDVRDEANDTAREMGASFDGSIDSVLDGFQELGANAGQAFGPLGIAAGAAAAVGVGLIRAEAEKLKELVGEMVEDMIESGGKLSDAFIDNKLQEMANDGTLLELQEQAAYLNISFEDLARAKAGDADASERVLARAAELAQALSDQAAKTGTASGEVGTMQTALNQLAGEMQGTVKANNLAERATSAYAKAAKDAGANTQNAAHVTGAAWDDLRGNLGRPIVARVAVNAPSAAEIDAVNRAIRRGIGTIVVPVRAGQSKFSNTSSNSRYRE